MEQKEHGRPLSLVRRGSSGRRVRPAQDGRPFFWSFKALRPWAQMNEPRGGVVRDGRFYEWHRRTLPIRRPGSSPPPDPSRGLPHDDLCQGFADNLRNSVEDPPSVANLPYQSIPHPPLSGDAGTGGEVMFLDGLASTLGCPRSSLTVPLPRGRVVFYSRNNRTSDRIFESPTRRSLEPTVGLFDDLHCSDNGKWPLGWRISRFRVEDKGPEKAEQPAMWEKGKRITEWNWRPGSPGSVALCPFAEAILAPVGAESINAQRRRDEFETRTASACPNASLHTAEWGGEANAFPRLSGTEDITSLWQSLNRRSTTHRLKWDKKPKRALFHPHLRVSPNP